MLPDPDVGVRIVAGTRVGEIELSSARVRIRYIGAEVIPEVCCQISVPS